MVVEVVVVLVVAVVALVAAVVVAVVVATTVVVVYIVVVVATSTKRRVETYREQKPDINFSQCVKSSLQPQHNLSRAVATAPTTERGYRWLLH